MGLRWERAPVAASGQLLFDSLPLAHPMATGTAAASIMRPVSRCRRGAAARRRGGASCIAPHRDHTPAQQFSNSGARTGRHRASGHRRRALLPCGPELLIRAPPRRPHTAARGCSRALLLAASSVPGSLCCCCCCCCCCCHPLDHTPLAPPVSVAPEGRMCVSLTAVCGPCLEATSRGAGTKSSSPSHTISRSWPGSQPLLERSLAGRTRRRGKQREESQGVLGDSCRCSVTAARLVGQHGRGGGSECRLRSVHVQALQCVRAKRA